MAANYQTVESTRPRVPEIPSSWEFQKLAEASLDAANAAFADCRARDDRFAAGSREDEATFMAITVAFLFLRSIELALKAATRERSLVPADDLRKKHLGHNLKNLIECATTAGGAPYSLEELGMDPPSKEFVDHFSDEYDNKWFEYHFGPWDIPPLEMAQRVATLIVEAVKPIARTLDAPRVE